MENNKVENKPKTKKIILIVILVILIITFITIFSIVIYSKRYYPKEIFNRSLDTIYKSSTKLLSRTQAQVYDYETDIVSMDTNITYKASQSNSNDNPLSNAKLNAKYTFDYQEHRFLTNLQYEENNTNILNIDLLQNNDNYQYINLHQIYNHILKQPLTDEESQTFDKFTEALTKGKNYKKDINRLLYLSNEITKKNIDKTKIITKKTTQNINSQNYNLTAYSYTLEKEELYTTIANIITDMTVNEEIKKILADDFQLNPQDLVNYLKDYKDVISENSIKINIYAENVYNPVGFSITINQVNTISYFKISNNYLFEIKTPDQNHMLEGTSNQDNQLNLTYSMNNEKLAKITYQKESHTTKLSLATYDEQSYITIDCHNQDNTSKILIKPTIEGINYGEFTIDYTITKEEEFPSDIITDDAIDINELSDKEQAKLDDNLEKQLAKSKLLEIIGNALNGPNTDLDSPLPSNNIS